MMSKICVIYGSFNWDYVQLLGRSLRKGLSNCRNAAITPPRWRANAPACISKPWIQAWSFAYGKTPKPLPQRGNGSLTSQK
jgi:hypothetical protein